MSTLAKLDLSSVASSQDQDMIREILGSLFWKWFDENKDMKISVIRFWIFRPNIYVRDLELIFILLFGNRNVSQLRKE